MKKVIKGMGLGLSITLALSVIAISSLVIAQTILGIGLAHVKGDSMDPSLKDGQVYMFAKRSSIKRYDIVLSGMDNTQEGKIIVKRVIGLPGDDLAVIDGKLYINNMYYEEPYVVHDSPVFETDVFRINLGEDEYFLMGDNRDHSTDSRDELGVVHKDQIRGVLKRDLTKLKDGVKSNE